MPSLTVTLDIDPAILYQQRLLLAYLAQYDTTKLLDGVMEVTDVLADVCADAGRKDALLTGTKAEHKKGRKMVADLVARILKGYAEKAATV